MKSSKLTKALCHFALPSVLVAGGFLTSCEDDLLTGTPSWLGSSIYAELEQRGNFTQELALINDPALSEYPRILSLTGSKTLFVADDNAWAEFFKNNPWGAKSLADLSVAQKQMLLKSSMIDNAYLIELLSNKAGSPPEEGACVRRLSSVSIYDSIPYVPLTSLPDLPQWEKMKTEEASSGSAYIINARTLSDVPPMMHLLPDYTQGNLISDADMQIITNGSVPTNKGSYVNGVAVQENEGDNINRDITCQNGYVHIVKNVPFQLQNMAEAVASRPELSIFHSMLERFSVPVKASVLSHGDGSQSNLYVKRYLNLAGNSMYPASRIGFNELELTKLNLAWDNANNKPLYVLRIDPGWNQYRTDVEGSSYETDGACIFAPTNAAFEDYARNEGKDLLDRYKCWDSIPLSTLCDLVNNHFQVSMKDAVPSKFSSVKNTASDELGITREDLVEGKVLMACNGVVYETNRVFIAPEYMAVSFPTKVRADLSVCQYAVENTDNLLNFKAYLTSTGARYCFIMPNDDAFKHYVSPASYGKKEPEVWNLSMKNGEVNAVATYLNPDTKGRPTQPDNTSIIHALRDIMQNHIVVLDENKMLSDRQKIYTNLAGGPVRIDNADSWANLRTSTDRNIGLAGSLLIERDSTIANDSVYVKGNGVSIVIKDQPLMTTKTTPYAALAHNEEYSAFYELLSNTPLISKTIDGKSGVDTCITSFNNYHYTVYVPSNESVIKLQNDGFLPVTADLDFLEKYENDRLDAYKNGKGDSVTNRLKELADKYKYAYPDTADDNHFTRLVAVRDSLIRVATDFVSYHFQDNALYIEGADQNNVRYETSSLDEEEQRFRKLVVNYDYNTFTVTPLWGEERKDELTRTVAINGKSNVVTRQYVFDASTPKYIYSSSYVVIHQIDEPLFFSASQYKR